MAASLYRLANKTHPLDAPATAAQVVDQIVVDTHKDEAPAPAVELEEPDNSLKEVESVPTDITNKDPEPPPAQAVAWDPNWTKAQLLEVALQLNLNVTVANTKTQIIEALKLATAT